MSTDDNNSTGAVEDSARLAGESSDRSTNLAALQAEIQGEMYSATEAAELITRTRWPDCTSTTGRFSLPEMIQALRFMAANDALSCPTELVVARIATSARLSDSNIEQIYEACAADPSSGVEEEADGAEGLSAQPLEPERQKAVHRLMRLLDTDGNGELDASEFLVYLRVALGSKSATIESAAASLRFKDADGNGALCENEVRAACAEYDAAAINRWAEKIDHNGVPAAGLAAKERSPEKPLGAAKASWPKEWSPTTAVVELATTAVVDSTAVIGRRPSLTAVSA